MVYRMTSCNYLWQTKAVGPHPVANLEVLFTRDRFTSFLCYLTFTMPPSFSVLVHQLTSDQVGTIASKCICTMQKRHCAGMRCLNFWLDAKCLSSVNF